MSATFNAIVHKAALETVAAQRWTRHLLIDSEPDGDGWALVVRGDDRAKAGAEGKNKPTFGWNDESGQARRFVVASYTGEGAQEQALKAAEGLRSFYAAEGKSFSERVAALVDEASLTVALMLAAVLQAGANAHANAASHWIVGSVNDTPAAKRAAREKKDKAAAVATITAAAKDPKALEQIAASVQTPEELEALAAIVATCKRNMAAA
jgi:hypothetical protein